ncbi:hypothetical protein DFH09DRAFT_570597 [Mycena vulgaris]|nr:hypothetical protein DFH09DRAFT_570597 [Mycena vulgaris]
MPSAHDSRFLPLTDFIRKVELDALTGSDSAFESALVECWSPHMENENIATSVRLTHASFRNLILTLRNEITDRTIVSETFVVSTPNDPTERTGAVGYTHVFAGVQGGKKIVHCDHRHRSAYYLGARPHACAWWASADPYRGFRYEYLLVKCPDCTHTSLVLILPFACLRICSFQTSLRFRPV